MRFKPVVIPNYDPNELQDLIDKSRAGSQEATNEILRRYEKFILGFTVLIKKGRFNLRSSSHVYFLRLFTNRGYAGYKDVASMIAAEFVNVSEEEVTMMIKKNLLQAIKEHEKNMYIHATALLRADVASALNNKGINQSNILNLVNIDCEDLNHLQCNQNGSKIDRIDIGFKPETDFDNLSYLERKQLRHQYINLIRND